MISSKIGSKALFWQRTFSTTRSQLSKVVVLGAAGGIGQPLSLLLKQNPLVSHLSLYDIVNAEGVATDISHINTASKVTGHGPANDGLSEALNGAKVVVVPAGVPRKPGMTRDDLFNTNAGIVRDLAEACARVCPTAHILIISNPVNSTVPIVSEVFKKHGVYDPKRIFGVTTLDVVRASKFVSEVTNISSDCSPVVIGGHSGITIIPLFSQLAGFNLSGEALDKLINRVQFGGDEVVKAKNGTGSATLSMAFAGARFANSVLRATVAGERGICEPSYVRSPVMEAEGVHYFSTKIELGPNGVEKIHPIGKVSAHEETLIKASIPELQKNIEKGVAFANKMGAY